jgi:hypothetical protein
LLFRPVPSGLASEIGTPMIRLAHAFRCLVSNITLEKSVMPCGITAEDTEPTVCLNIHAMAGDTPVISMTMKHIIIHTLDAPHIYPCSFSSVIPFLFASLTSLTILLNSVFAPLSLSPAILFLINNNENQKTYQRQSACAYDKQSQIKVKCEDRQT